MVEISLPNFHLVLCLQAVNISAREFSILGFVSNRILFFSSKHNLHELLQVLADLDSLWMLNVTLGVYPESLSSHTFLDSAVPFLLCLCLKLCVWVWNLVMNFVEQDP